MANPATINSLCVQARARADALFSQTFDDTLEIKTWVRDSLAMLFESLVSEWPDWAVQTRPLTLVAGQATYILPPDFRSEQVIYAVYGGYKQPLDRFTINDLGASRYALQFRISGRRLEFRPTPQTDAQNGIEIHYTPVYRGPILDTSSISDNLPTGWEEWVVLDVCRKIRLRLRLDADYIIQQQQEVERRILRGAFRREQTVYDVTDVRSRSCSIADAYCGSTLAGPTYWVP